MGTQVARATQATTTTTPTRAHNSSLGLLSVRRGTEPGFTNRGFELEASSTRPAQSCIDLIGCCRKRLPSEVNSLLSYGSLAVGSSSTSRVALRRHQLIHGNESETATTNSHFGRAATTNVDGGSSSSNSLLLHPSGSGGGLGGLTAASLSLSSRKTQPTTSDNNKRRQRLTKRRSSSSFLLLAAPILLATVISLHLQSFEFKSVDTRPSELQASLVKHQEQTSPTPPPPPQQEQAATTKGSALDLFTKFKSLFTGSSYQTHSIITTTPIPSITNNKLILEAETTTTLLAATSPPEDIEDNDSSTEHDDDDAESCEGLSAGESAETKNYTDNERLVNLQSCLQGKIKRYLLKSRRSGMEMFEKLSLSGGCSHSIMTLTSSLGELKSFAFKFIDASAKVPSGMMSGVLSDFGDFDQCLSIRSNPNVALENEHEEGAFSGKYCLLSVRTKYHVHLRPNTTVPDGIIEDGLLWDRLVRNYWTTNSTKGFQVGVCLPSRCTDDDVAQLVQLAADNYNANGEILDCQDALDLSRQQQPDLVQLIITNLFYLLLVLTFVGTAIERYYPELNSARSTTLLNQTHSPTHKRSSSSIQSAQVRGSDNASRLTLALRISVCFSIARNWRIFMRKDQQSPSNYSWDYLSSNNSTASQASNSPTSNANETTLTTTTSDNSSGCHHRSDDDSSSGSSTLRQTDDSGPTCRQPPVVEQGGKKLGQLTVKIQPDDGLGEQYGQIGRSLSQLSGLRLFVVLWITMGQSFLYPSAHNYQYYRSIIRMDIAKDSVWFAITNFTLGIDMLLYMTGLVFVVKLGRLSSGSYELGNRLTMKLNLSSGGILRLMSKKILRFWPTYLTLIALAIWIPLISDGPRWPEMVSKRLAGSCRQNWWSNLLFINNYLQETQICLPSSWFVSVVMQLFLIGSIVIVLIRRYSLQIALAALSSLILMSCSVSFLFAYLNYLKAPVVRLDESFVMEMDESIFRLYTNIFNNLGPFLVGMAGGILLIQSKISVNLPQISRDNPKKPSSALLLRLRHILYHLIVAAIVIILAMLVLSSVFYQHYSRLLSAIYWSCHRVGWAVVTGYIIHNCATGRWKLLNDFLSLSTFIPLSRLIFIAYLVYPIFIHLHIGSVRDGLHVNNFNMLNIYITRLVLTFSTALLIHLLVELPFCSIEELYLNRWMDKLNKDFHRDHKSSKFHPLLAVAPVVTLQFNESTKMPDDNESPIKDKLDKTNALNARC